MIGSNLVQAIVGGRILINLNNLVAWPARTGIQRVCYEFCSRWPYLEDTIPFVELGLDKIGLLEPDFFKYLSQYFEQEDEVLADLSETYGIDVSEISPGWLGIVSARNRIVCEVSVEDALKYCRCVMSLEESLNMEFFSLAAKTRPEKIFNLCHDFLSWTHPEYFGIDWRNADNVSASIANRRKYANNFFTSSAMREQYVTRINRGDTRSYAVIPPGADGFGRTFRKAVPESSEFVVVGTLEPRKQPLRILDSFIELQSEGVDARLCFAGRMGWLEPEDRERLIQAFETYSWLRWVDGPGDAALRDLIASCRATIYLSEAEGFGSPPVESLALGVPCIVSAVIPSVIDMAPNGQIRIQPQDDLALIGAVRRLLDDSEVSALQDEIQTLALPTWQGFVDGIAALVDEKAPATVSPGGRVAGYTATLEVIRVLMRLWESDRSTLIRDLLSAALPEGDELNVGLWDSRAREGGWNNVEAVLQIMKALPPCVISPSLVNEAIAGRLSVGTMPASFAKDWSKTVNSLLAIDADEAFEEAIYTVVHKRTPGAGELCRSELLRTGQCSRVEVLLEAIQSDEYRNRLTQLVMDGRVRDELDSADGQVILASIDWQKRLLEDYRMRSAVGRCLRFPAGANFLQLAFRDLVGTYPPKDANRFTNRLHESDSGKEMVLLEILLSEPCVRRVGNPAAHLDLVHWLAGRVGIKARPHTDALSLAIKVNQVLALSRREFAVKAPMILLGVDGDESARFVEDLLKRYADGGPKSDEERADLAAGLLFFGLLSGTIGPDNPILGWAAERLAKHHCPASFQQKKEQLFGKPTLAASFASLGRSGPSAEQREILDGWERSAGDRQLLLEAIRLFAFRQGRIEDRYLHVLDIAREFQLLGPRWPELMKKVDALELAMFVEPVADPAQAFGDVARVVDVAFKAEAPVAVVPGVSQDIAVPGITTVDQLLSFNGEAFVRNVYETFMHRNPDLSGLNHYLGRLASGASKQSVVCDIATSVEGKRIGADLIGLDALIASQSRRRRWFWKALVGLGGLRG